MHRRPGQGDGQRVLLRDRPTAVACTRTRASPTTASRCSSTAAPTTATRSPAIGLDEGRATSTGAPSPSTRRRRATSPTTPDALEQSCADLVGQTGQQPEHRRARPTGSSGQTITAGGLRVGRRDDARRSSSAPTRRRSATSSRSCSRTRRPVCGNQPATTVFAEDFESGLDGWTLDEPGRLRRMAGPRLDDGHVRCPAGRTRVGRLRGRPRRR